MTQTRTEKTTKKPVLLIDANGRIVKNDTMSVNDCDYLQEVLTKIIVKRWPILSGRVQILSDRKVRQELKKKLIVIAKSKFDKRFNWVQVTIVFNAVLRRQIKQLDSKDTEQFQHTLKYDTIIKRILDGFESVETWYQKEADGYYTVLINYENGESISWMLTETQFKFVQSYDDSRKCLNELFKI